MTLTNSICYKQNIVQTILSCIEKNNIVQNKKDCSMRLLIVDDSDLISQRLKELLQDLEDLEIIDVASNGYDGIEKYWRYKPDVVILDIKLPKINGIEVLQNIRKVKSPATIIVLTNYNNSYFKDVCLTEGADYFLDKSTEFEKVYEILNELLIEFD
ncbi:MAG: response regulator transcription factor [Ignavibacteriaceae bacterium]